MTNTEPRWTISELNERVANALAEGYHAPRNGQVRAVPNTRSIRYYTTLGLLDRPIEMRGRTALYTSRHLLQIVAIKRLQAEGMTLADVQARLAGIDVEALRGIARIPSAGAPQRARARKRGRDARFWTATPSDDVNAKPVEEHDLSGHTPPVAGMAPEMLVHVPLAAGVTLVVDPARPFTEDDGRALRAAAAVLMRQLETSGLVRSH